MKKTLIPLNKSILSLCTALPLLAAALLLAAWPARADYPNTNATKWVQYPDFIRGMDVLAAKPIVLADDFLCTNSGPVTDIHLWTSWLGDTPDTNNTVFTLAIWSDVPAGRQTPSHPGSLLWHQSFGPGQYALVPAMDASERFWNPEPSPMGTPMGTDNRIFQYNFYPTTPFTQQGNPQNPVVYWLSVSAEGSAVPFGWKTSTNHWNDAAVWGHTTGGTGFIGDWQPMQDPQYQAWLDLAFAVTTTNSPPPPPCPETNGVKYVQSPDVFAGMDVLATPLVLGDDFVCTNTGRITDIHLWTSWRFDQVDPTAKIWLGIYDDVPAYTNQGQVFPSHPGALKWEQWFLPGQYVQTPFTNGFEYFYDPAAKSVIGSDTQMWYYCFYPTNPFRQEGQPNQPKIYWLLAHAEPQNTQGELFGWKTTSFAQHDTAVWASWPGGPPPPSTPWQPIAGPNGQPLDLSFKITTDTNCGPPVLLCTNRTLQCESFILNDPPGVIDPCCPTPVPFIVSINKYGSCPRIYEVTWAVTNCLGYTVSCIQTNIVQDTNPPVITAIPPGGDLGCNPAWIPDDAAVHAQVAATDVCGLLATNVTHLDGGTPCAPTRAFTITVMDYCTNTVIKNVVYTWRVDTNPPVVLVPAGGNLGCNPATVPDDAAMRLLVAVNDDCAVLVTNVTHADGGTACNSNRTFTVVGMDTCLNATTQTVVYTWMADTTPPTITCPTDIVVTSCSTNQAVVWTVTGSDNCGPATVVCTPPSGTVFALDSTNCIHCVATDGCGNTNACDFQVIVRRPALLGTLAITRAGTLLTITWTSCGILQYSDNLVTWADVLPAPSSPYSTPASAAHRFYRLRCN